jgi:hypothetical protein
MFNTPMLYEVLEPDDPRAQPDRSHRVAGSER